MSFYCIKTVVSLLTLLVAGVKPACREKSQRVQVVELLLEHGSDINIMNNNGMTPLMMNIDVKNISGQYGDEQIAMFQTLAKHAAKMVELGQYVSDLNLHVLQRSEAYHPFYSDCLEELRAMREYELTKGISLFDVLTADKEKLESYARDRDFLSAFRASEHQAKFPIHANDLDCRVEAAAGVQTDKSGSRVQDEL